MMLWQATPANLWQGRDDSAEAPNALRLFQTIPRAERFAPQEMPGDIALLGFACDEGVRRNKGRTGAADGPATLRRALANMAAIRATTAAWIWARLASKATSWKPRIRRCARR